MLSALWKSYFGLVRDHFGECAMEELLWASHLVRAHFGECAVEELFWAVGITLMSVLWKSYCGSGITLVSVLWKG